ncbi:MAG TPA: hypothetical protein VFC73_06515 [Syntrophomonadaceae bacterium]|nr:hypothetical protein [Syntrophomonadaceae bacterium]
MFMQTINATEVRKEFSQFIDTVVREKPVVIKRNRDHVLSISLEQTINLLTYYRFNMNIFDEEDGSITATLNELDLIINTMDKDNLKNLMAQEILDYAEDYFEQFNLYYNSPNRQKHFPYVLKAILANNIKDVAGFIDA